MVNKLDVAFDDVVVAAIFNNQTAVRGGDEEVLEACGVKTPVQSRPNL